MVLEDDPLSSEISDFEIQKTIENKTLSSSIIDRDERTILGEERRLASQEKKFIRQTSRDPLTLNRQFSLAGSFGLGGVQFGAKRLFEVKKRGRRIVKPRFSKAKKEITKSKQKIKQRREAISSITSNTIIDDFGIDLSKFMVDTSFR